MAYIAVLSFLVWAVASLVGAPAIVVTVAGWTFVIAVGIIVFWIVVMLGFVAIISAFSR